MQVIRHVAKQSKAVRQAVFTKSTEHYVKKQCATNTTSVLSVKPQLAKVCTFKKKKKITEQETNKLDQSCRDSRLHVGLIHKTPTTFNKVTMYF